MRWGRAFGAGVAGGAVMSVLMALARAAGVDVSFERLLGTAHGALPGPGTWLLGLVLHLALSGLLGLLYGWGLEALAPRRPWLAGLRFGAVHALLAGAALALLPSVHALMPTQIQPPGPFLVRLGLAGVLVHVVLHLAYGLVVGHTYGPPATAARAEGRRVARAA
jgi:hypothetical protein